MLTTDKNTPSVNTATTPPSVVTPPADLPRTTQIVDDGNAKITHKIVVQYKAGYPDKPIEYSFTTIATTDEADDVSVRMGMNGRANVLINGRTYDLPTPLAKNEILYIVTNGGNDRVKIDPSIQAQTYTYTEDGDDYVHAGSGHTTIYGGNGNDDIRAGTGMTTVYGEDGNDTIRLGEGFGYASGGKGNDIMLAGHGNSELYGGDGDDDMYAGDGPENRTVFLNGNDGDDFILAGDGINVLTGGSGDDTLSGSKRSSIYTGKGKDTVIANNEKNRVYAKETDKIQNLGGAKITYVAPSDAGQLAFKIEGTPDETAYLNQLLDELRASPAGQTVLEEMDRLALQSGNPIILRTAKPNEFTAKYNFDSNAAKIYTKKEAMQYEKSAQNGYIIDGKPGAASIRAEIAIKPGPGTGTPPTSQAILLFHQIIHAYNGATGTIMPGKQPSVDNEGKEALESNEERQAIGLPTTETPYDSDNDPTTPPTTVNAKPFFENALRKEMGLPPLTKSEPYQPS